MSNRWPGGLIRKTPVTPAGPAQNGAAPGVWTLAEAAFWTKQGLWPIAGNVADGTFAIFALGGTTGCVPTTTRNKYTYSGDAVSAGGAATAASYLGSAAGNSTVGIFALGLTTVRVTTRNKYTYSGCVVAAGGAATVASRCSSAAGNSTVGIFALGCTSTGVSTTRDKYTYSGCVVSAGGAATVVSLAGSAASNGINGITM